MANIHLQQPRLLVIVVNYRTPDLTVACLRSLAAEAAAWPRLRAVVVDNGSGDGSASKLRRAIVDNGWSGWAALLAREQNRGFAAGNNAALRPALASPAPPDFVFLLNPDAEVRPGAVGALVSFLNEHPDVGIVGSRLEDPAGVPQCSAFRFPTVVGQFLDTLRLGVASRLWSRWLIAPSPSDAAHEAEWVSGAAMMARGAVLERVGVLDEGYFLYFEEVDFCLAAHRAGWRTWHVPESRVLHFEGQATGFADPKRTPERRPSYWFESRRRYFLKNHGRFYAACADAAWMAGYVLCRVRRGLMMRPNTDPPRFLRDFFRHSVFVRGFRREESRS